MRFGLLSLLLPYSVFLCVVPLPDCTNSINAAKGRKIKELTSWQNHRVCKNIFCKSLTLYIKAFMPILVMSHPVNPRKSQRVRCSECLQIKSFRLKLQFKRQERLCRLQSFQTQIDTLHFQGHTSDSMVRMSLVIDRIIDLHKENSNWDQN